MNGQLSRGKELAAPYRSGESPSCKEGVLQRHPYLSPFFPPISIRDTPTSFFINHCYSARLKNPKEGTLL
ncbi:MAG: hypothetical protein V4487_03455 [Chlamydiota bacterium]